MFTQEWFTRVVGEMITEESLNELLKLFYPEKCRENNPGFIEDEMKSLMSDDCFRFDTSVIEVIV